MVALEYYKLVDGHTLWFSHMSDLGPQLTANPEDAMSFIDKAMAKSHPAYSHPICMLAIAPHPLEKENE